MRSSLFCHVTVVLLVSATCGCGPDRPPAGPGSPIDSGAVPGIDSGPTSTCAVDLSDCGGSCVDTDSTFEHCGACHHACVEGEVCSQGACSAEGCAGGTITCSGSCLDVSSDPSHCGSCDRACGAGETCQAGECVGCGTGISFTNDVQPIFTGSCLGGACHAGTRPAGDLSLESGRAYDALVGVSSSCSDGRPLVAPSDADGNYLVQKITGVEICQGNRMPLGGRALTTAEVDAIRGWICGGARRD